MRRISLTLAVLLLMMLVQDARGSCRVNCPGGHLGVCVERGGQCECSCIMGVDKAAGTVRVMLQRLGVSEAGIQTGINLFSEELNSGKRDFTVTFTDEHVEVTIRAMEGKEISEAVYVE